MALEIERKFLVEAKNLAGIKLTGGKEIVQGYLTTKPVVRVRLEGSAGYLTIKSKTEGIVRREYEYQIPRVEAAEILKLCAAVVQKTRYKIKYAGKIFDLDVFSGKHQGLILAEVELKTADEVIELPEWLGEEVSGKAEYYNSNLATS